MKENTNRQLILNYLGLNGELTISQLSQLLRVSRPTIYLHLDILEKKGFIGRKKNPKKKGAPVTIYRKEKNISAYEKKELVFFLRRLKAKGSMDVKEVFEFSKESNFHSMYLDATLRKLVSKRISLTKEGDEYLKQNERSR